MHNNHLILQVMRRAELVIESRLGATEEKHGYCCLPRIIRMCRKFSLSQNEARMAIYCLICQFSKQHKAKHVEIDHSYFSLEEHRSDNSIPISQYLDVPIMEVLNFLRKERQHMQKELFNIFKEDDIGFKFKITYDKDYSRILMGSKVTRNEFLKLNQNFLADIVSEEPGNEHLK